MIIMAHQNKEENLKVKHNYLRRLQVLQVKVFIAENGTGLDYQEDQKIGT